MTGSVDVALIPARAGRSNPRWSHAPADRRYEPNNQPDARRRQANSAGLPVRVSRSDRRGDAAVESTGRSAWPGHPLPQVAA
jgi:hypothetical protein